MSGASRWLDAVTCPGANRKPLTPTRASAATPAPARRSRVAVLEIDDMGLLRPLWTSPAPWVSLGVVDQWFGGGMATVVPLWNWPHSPIHRGTGNEDVG